MDHNSGSSSLRKTSRNSWFKTHKITQVQPLWSDNTSTEEPTDTESCAKCKHSVRPILNDFAQYTSAHGIARIQAASTDLRKGLWIMICCAAYGFLLYMCYLVIFQYVITKPITTTIDFKYEKKIPFPTITFCNHNMLKVSSLKRTTMKRFKFIMDYMLQMQSADSKQTAKNTKSDEKNNTLAEPTTNLTEQLANATDPVLQKDLENVLKGQETFKKRIRFKGNKDTSDAHDFEIDPTDYMTQFISKMTGNINPKLAKEMGHSMNEMISECTFKGFNCFSRDFIKFWRVFWHWKYGNCFVFNSGIDAHGAELPVLTIDRSGPGEGLRVDLFLNQNEYIPALSPEAGVRVTITDQGKAPFPYEEGFSIRPGSSTSVGLQKVSLHRVDPFNNMSCTDEISEELKKGSVTHRWKNATYSVKLCLSSCLSDAQVSSCNCTESRFIVEGKSKCCISPKQEECLEEVKVAYENGNLQCLDKCPQRCNENLFRYVLSSSSWSEHFKLMLKKTLEKRMSSNHKRVNISSFDIHCSSNLCNDVRRLSFSKGFVLFFNRVS